MVAARARNESNKPATSARLLHNTRAKLPMGTDVDVPSGEARLYNKSTTVRKIVPGLWPKRVPSARNVPADELVVVKRISNDRASLLSMPLKKLFC